MRVSSGGVNVTGGACFAKRLACHTALSTAERLCGPTRQMTASREGARQVARGAGRYLTCCAWKTGKPRRPHHCVLSQSSEDIR